MKLLILITAILSLNACAALAPATVLGIGIATGAQLNEEFNIAPVKKEGK